MAKKTAKSKVDYQAMPPQPMEGQVTDRQAQFRTLTRSAPERSEAPSAPSWHPS